MRKAFICPTKYVQGENELLNLGYFVKTFGKKALLIADPFALNLVKEKLDATQAKYGVEFVTSDIFKGECSRTVVKALQRPFSLISSLCSVGTPAVLSDGSSGFLPRIAPTTGRIAVLNPSGRVVRVGHTPLLFTFLLKASIVSPTLHSFSFRVSNACL